MTTAIVILNWNGKDFLEKYLSCLLESVKDYPDVTVVVADNGSEDGSVGMLKKEFPCVHLIELPRNYGFAEGYNRALGQLPPFDCFLLLNSDVRVEDGWFEPLQEWMELHPECGICGPKLHKEPDNGDFEYSGAAGGYIDRLGFPFCRGRIMETVEKDEGQYNIPEDVLWVSGAALMIRSELFFKLGGFWGPFFAHMEEIDLCWRARREGWKVTVVPRSTVFHIGGGSLPPDSPGKLKLNFRNNLLMLQRNLPATFALNAAFNLLAYEADPDTGPDLFVLCSGIFLEYDSSIRKDLTQICAHYGLRKTAMLLKRRILVDDIAAFVYLLRGKPACFKAVFRAHREFRKMRKAPALKSVVKELCPILDGKSLGKARVLLTDSPGEGNNYASSFGIRGMWNKWTVWQSLVNKKSIFAEIKDGLV